MEEDRLQKAEKLARDVLKLARNTLLVNLRFMDTALSRFTLVPGETDTLMTDGEKLWFDPLHVLRVFAVEKEASVRDYLHVVLHCVFQHMFVAPNVDWAVWDLACDVAVEAVITGLGLPSADADRAGFQGATLSMLRERDPILTAEKIYRQFLQMRLTSHELERYRDPFRADDHAARYAQPENGGAQESQDSDGGDRNSGDDASGDESFGDGDGSGQGSGHGGSDGTGEPQQDISDGGDGSFDSGTQSTRAALAQMWKDISQRIQEDMQTFSRQRSDGAGAMMQNLAAVNREKYDYTEFLKKFAVRCEVMKLDPDEFDYIFYTYGLSLYGKMPLIEPLEYRDAKRIREFVIAIDTSGSVEGELVQTFVQKTYNILKSTESFASRINLHILQCDAEIQEDVKITSQAEFDEYMRTMTLRGFGGTDFRPVFRKVDEMIADREFTNLKGLIYFTDGYGVFPERKPPYDAAFVFIDDDYGNPEVPPWAIKLVLQKDEI